VADSTGEGREASRGFSTIAVVSVHSEYIRFMNRSVYLLYRSVYLLFQGEPMETYWLEGRQGLPEFDLANILALAAV